MNVILSGIDHSAASVAERERFALSRPAQQELLARAARTPGVLGAVLLSTCNRTELCLSLEEGAELRPFSLFEAEPEGAYTYAGREAFGHLAALAAGLKSRLFAEDQILTQVKNALVQARQAGTADAILEVFFREAVTAAKRVKTETRFSHGDVSAALAARDVALSCPGVRQVLVIGNGEVGRAAAAAQAEAGLDVTMTDINARAVELARRNAAANGATARVVQGDGYAQSEGRYDAIVTNPPIRAGKAVIYALFDDARDRLAPGGALYIVIRKQQGAPSALKHLGEVYSNVEILDREAGFWVIRASDGCALS